MEFPAVEIKPDDALNSADAKVEKAFEQFGSTLVAFESLNTLLSTSNVCHFFHVDYRDRPCVLVVTNRPWEEQTLITVLNVLLEMRMDPDPPGSRLAFHFYSAYSVPDILMTLFGDSPASEFECRSCLVARFGNELRPVDCQRLAAVAVSLSRHCFALNTSLDDPHGEERIVEGVCRYLRGENLSVEPLNSLIVYGCLYGEALRSKMAYPSRWDRVEHYEPWPGLLFRSANGAGGEAAGKGSQEVAFNPIAHVINLYQQREQTQLATATQNLAARCEQAFGTRSL